MGMEMMILLASKLYETVLVTSRPIDRSKSRQSKKQEAFIFRQLTFLGQIRIRMVIFILGLH
jgi:hypothetical protein